MDKQDTIAIVGGGAAGLSAALHCFYISKGKVNITILEKNDRVGKKILATGNGRCNFTNIYATYKNYYGKDKTFTKYFLEEFNVSDTLDFFYKLGVVHKTLENGKTYPYSEQASAIVDALRNGITSNNIPIKTNFEVEKINKKHSNFEIISKTGEKVFAKKIIFATGGFASPNLGTNGGGIKILQKLGHNCTKVTPALVQLKTNDIEKVKPLKGIKITGKIRFYSKDKFLKEEIGEILFTEYGISGPPIFQLSTLFSRYKNLKTYIDFMPEYNEDEILKFLIDRKKFLANLTMEDFFNGLLNKRVGNIIAKDSGIEKLSLKVCNLSDSHLKKMVFFIKNYELNIIDTNGFNNCQVTAGGIFTDEFDNKTLESKIIKGLYCCGEILDVVGDCGGFNLQWAWTSSYVASRECVKSILKKG